MRLYSVAIASLAIQAPEKWTDNLLSHHKLPGVHARSRGVSRGISWPGLIHVALARELHVRMGCAVRDSVAFAATLLESPTHAIAVGSSVTLAFDRERFERALHGRLADALEMAPRPRRGRPAYRAPARS